MENAELIIDTLLHCPHEIITAVISKDGQKAEDYYKMLLGLIEWSLNNCEDYEEFDIIKKIKHEYFIEVDLSKGELSLSTTGKFILRRLNDIFRLLDDCEGDRDLFCEFLTFKWNEEINFETFYRIKNWKHTIAPSIGIHFQDK